MYVQKTSDFTEIGGPEFHVVSLDAPLSRAQEISAKLNSATVLQRIGRSNDAHCHFCLFSSENKCSAMFKYDIRSREALRILKEVLGLLR